MSALTGVLPIAPTPFDEAEEVDYDGQKRVVDFLIDARVDGICILANYSEQFALSDAERERLSTVILEHVAGRVPVIVTTSHFSSRVAAERSRRAQEQGASMVMLMPPYHGVTIRPSDEQAVVEFFAAVAAKISVPIMIQDAPVSGVTLPAALLARLAREIPQVQYAKVEVAFAADKLRQLIALAGPALPGPFDGEESITLLADLDAGATGTMPSALQPDLIGPIVRHYLAGEREKAVSLYERSLPLINFENRQCGLRATKALMHEGGIIASERVRGPQRPLHAATRAGLLELAKRLDPLILRWAR